MPTSKPRHAGKDCQSGLGRTSSSYSKAPKISPALTSPSGNVIVHLLQGTESSYPYVLPAPSALSPSGTRILSPQRCTRCRACIYRCPEPGPARTRRSTERPLSRHVPVHLEPEPPCSPWVRTGYCGAQFCFPGYVVPASFAFRLILTKEHRDAPLPSVDGHR